MLRTQRSLQEKDHEDDNEAFLLLFHFNEAPVE
jgi:hypothetical protein